MQGSTTSRYSRKEPSLLSQLSLFPRRNLHHGLERAVEMSVGELNINYHAPRSRLQVCCFTFNTCGAGDNSTNKAAASHRTTSSGDDIIRLYTLCTKQLAFGIVLRMDF